MHLCLSVVWQFVIALGYHILENVRPLGDPLGDHIPGSSVSLGDPWATTSKGMPYPWATLGDQRLGNSLPRGHPWATASSGIPHP